MKNLHGMWNMNFTISLKEGLVLITKTHGIN